MTGRVILSAVGLIAAGVVGGGVAVNRLSDDGSLRTDTYVAGDELNIALTETGSDTALGSTQRYTAACVANPLATLTPSQGSGTVRWLSYSNSANPAGVSPDIGFVYDCDDKTASGETLMNNGCTESGCVENYTTGTATWNGEEYIKVTFDGDPTDAYSGRVRIEYEDYYGE